MRGDRKKEDTSRVHGAAGSTLGGAVAGAVMGTTVGTPVVGTIIGAVSGAAAALPKRDAFQLSKLVQRIRTSISASACVG